MAEMEAVRRQQEKQQGLGRPIISLCHMGYRIVAVGSVLHYSKKWKTFHDFLFDYVKIAMGEEWGTEEIKKDFNKRHPILQWNDLICKYQREIIKEPEKVSEAPMTGAVQAYLDLSYNLYLLAHNLELQSRLINRLKNPDQFNGAYYETFVAATLIKAGFNLELENEEDVSSSHCEFTATFENTGTKYSVEAKSREPHKTSAVITNQLYNALRKTANHQRVVFIDVNVPETADEIQSLTWLQEAVLSMREKETDLTINGQPAPEAYVFVTNHPCRYALERPAPRQVVLGEGFKIPDFKHDFTSLSIREALHVRDKHHPMFKVIDSVKDHSDIPSTFDGEIPEFAFGEPNVPRLKIGEKYLVPREDGVEVVGILQDAFVSEEDRIIFGVYALEDGRKIIASRPITDNELSAYRKYPETFFGVHKPNGRKIRDGLDMFDFLYETYKHTSREKLIELLQNHPDIEKLKQESQEELAITYCERWVYSNYKSEPDRQPIFPNWPRKST
ncbi:MAG: hypothetical protein MRJ96_06895 [Nitrospirales bacterium]|nr:hypothetical protein [Nitrospirales bacterium]